MPRMLYAHFPKSRQKKNPKTLDLYRLRENRKISAAVSSSMFSCLLPRRIPQVPHSRWYRDKPRLVSAFRIQAALSHGLIGGVDFEPNGTALVSTPSNLTDGRTGRHYVVPGVGHGQLVAEDTSVLVLIQPVQNGTQ